MPLVLRQFECVPVADVGVLMRVDQAISEAAEHTVQAADRAILAAELPGVTETIPSYTSLFIGYDAAITDYASICAQLDLLELDDAHAIPVAPHYDVPICYDGPHDNDLAVLANSLGMSRDAIINIHLSGDYHVSLYGFAPGYAYMRGVPTSIQLPRKPTPVSGVPAGSVIIAGPQCLVTTLTMPAGWWRVGFSPFRFLRGQSADPFPIPVGSSIRFRRVSLHELDTLDHA
ncbi:MAG: carboxyltransferase domain-containing protein [Pseudomonadota bacterium]